MRKTPKEIAESGNYFDQERWLLSATIEEMCGFFTYSSVDSHEFHFARAVLDIKLSENAERTAQKIVTGTDKLVQHSAKLTEQTDRLVSETLELRRFTKGVLWLTFILAIVAIIEIYQVFSHN